MLKRISVVEKDKFDKPKADVVNGKDIITTDVPFLLALLEYIKEEGEELPDVDLHYIAERLIEHSKTHVVGMDCFYKITNRPSVMTEETMLFRMNSRTLWSRFAWSLLNYSVALNSEIDGKEQAEARIYKHAENIGMLAAPYIGEAQGKVLGEALTTFGRIGVKVMQDLKDGKPLDGTKELWDKNIDEISIFLSTLNPKAWPKEPVKSYFDMLVKFWIDSIAARNARDWPANEIAIDNIDKLVTTGAGDMTSLADVFSGGIVEMYPEKFSS